MLVAVLRGRDCSTWKFQIKELEGSTIEGDSPVDLVFYSRAVGQRFLFFRKIMSKENDTPPQGGSHTPFGGVCNLAQCKYYVDMLPWAYVVFNLACVKFLGTHPPEGGVW